MYLPSDVTRNENTFFLLPSPEMTLTIPSTSSKAITVGAYNSRLQAYADDNQFDDTKFVRRNEDGMKYFFVENGTIFKLDENEYRFYELDLDEFVWDLKPSLVDLYYDVSLRYSEIEDFNDYYLNKSEEFDIDSGRQL